MDSEARDGKRQPFNATRCSEQSHSGSSFWSPLVPLVRLLLAIFLVGLQKALDTGIPIALWAYPRNEAAPAMGGVVGPAVSIAVGIAYGIVQPYFALVVGVLMESLALHVKTVRPEVAWWTQCYEKKPMARWVFICLRRFLNSILAGGVFVGIPIGLCNTPDTALDTPNKRITVALVAGFFLFGLWKPAVDVLVFRYKLVLRESTRTELGDRLTKIALGKRHPKLGEILTKMCAFSVYGETTIVIAKLFAHYGYGRQVSVPFSLVDLTVFFATFEFFWLFWHYGILWMKRGLGDSPLDPSREHSGQAVV